MLHIKLLFMNTLKKTEFANFIFDVDLASKGSNYSELTDMSFVVNIFIQLCRNLFGKKSKVV